MWNSRAFPSASGLRETSCLSYMVMSFVNMTSNPDHFFPSSGPVARGIVTSSGNLKFWENELSAHVLLFTNLACLQGARCIHILSYNDLPPFFHFYRRLAKQLRRSSGFGYHLTKWSEAIYNLNSQVVLTLQSSQRCHKWYQPHKHAFNLSENE